MTADRPTEVVLRAPPTLPGRELSGGAWLSAVPMLGSLGAVAVFATARDGAGPQHMLAAGCFLLGTVAFVVIQVERQHRQRSLEVAAGRSAYLRHLARARDELDQAAEAEYAALLAAFPESAALPWRVDMDGRGPTPVATANTPSAASAGELPVRVGVGPGPAAVRVVVAEDEGSTGRVDDACRRAQHRLAARHREHRALPALLDLRAAPELVLDGMTDDARAAARAVVCSAAQHDPTRLRIAVLAERPRLVAWDWVKWLPHARSDRSDDALGPRRLLADSGPALAALLPEADAPQPHLLVVLDGEHDAAAYLGPGRTVLRIAPELRTGGADPGARVLDLAGERPRIDRCPTAVAEACARRVAGHAGGHGVPHRGNADTAPALPTPPAGHRDPDTLLCTPIGTDNQGGQVLLDLKESARGGVGPHGLLVGATGSGKSELLRTLVLGLASGHTTDELALVLVDFKGGATFAGLADLPHVSALITNLADDLALLERMYDALAGEMTRRQEVLRDAGHGSVHEHEQARTGGAPVEPLPSLVVVVDEFTELLTARPDLIELFVAVGRLGRSLGLHLLLSSQRLEEGRLRGLEAHLSYRIALRTFSASESRSVLGVPDAHDLPPVPGIGFLATGPDAPRRFRAGYVSGPTDDAPRVAAFGTQPLPFTAGELVGPDAGRPQDDRHTTTASPLMTRVAALAGSQPSARRIWLPPLAEPPWLADLVGAGAGRPGTPVGILDLPRSQCREPLRLDLDHAGGHVAVIGGPRSGKSALLTTLVTGLAADRTPQQLQAFVLDLDGGCADIALLPHTVAHAGRAEPELVRRVVTEVEARVSHRAASSAEDNDHGEVCLVVDSWSTLQAEDEDLAARVQRLAATGPAAGVHVLVAANRWGELRPALRDLLGFRLELRLGEPLESDVDHRIAADVPVGRPGRGIVAPGVHFLSASPASTTALAVEIAASWTGPLPAPLRLLPAQVELAALPASRTVETQPGTGLRLGLAEATDDPATWEPGLDPHLLVLGDTGAGRSSTLRTLLSELRDARDPRQAQVVLVDPRRSLRGIVPGAQLLHHLTVATPVADSLTELAAYLEGRLPGAEVGGERGGWSGAEVFVVVDDHDLLTTRGPSPLLPLVPLLPQAPDVGLHLVLARRTAGMARAAYEPVLSTLRDLGSPALLLAGSPEEGPLVRGVRAAPAVPGRGRLVTRDAVRPVQVALADAAQ